MERMVANGCGGCNSYQLVLCTPANGYRFGMRPKALRRENLLLLIKEFGSISEVAKRSRSSEKYLSQVVNQVVQSKTPRGIGDVVAQRLEDGCGKPSGWMDTPHDDALPPQEAAFAERVQSELLAHEVPKHIQDAILTLLASSPPRKS